MILSELLDTPVHDGEGQAVGFVVDVRLALDGPFEGPLAAPRIVGLLVSPRTGTSFLGYERRDEQRPALLAHLLRRRHRGTFLVQWPDVVAVEEGSVRLRASYRRWSPMLRRTGS